MKRSILPALLLLTLFSQAQELNLKKGQSATYETLSITDFGTNKFANFSEISFLVLSAQKDRYVLQVSRPRFINGDDRAIIDSKEELKDIPRKPVPVGNKIRTLYDYRVTIDRTGKVLEMTGTDVIRDSALATIKRLDAKDPRMVGDYLSWEFGDQNFKRSVERILAVRSFNAKDTMMTGKRAYQTTIVRNGVASKDSVFTIDTMFVKKSMGSEVKTGLLVNLSDDSTAYTYDVKKNEKSFRRELWRINLKSSTIRSLGFGPLLYDEFRKVTDYDVYFSPDGLAARKVSQMTENFLENKGKPGLADSIRSVISDLDKDRTDTDYAYMMAKANILGYMGTGAEELIRVIPYERLSSAFFVMQKLEEELRTDDTRNMNRALQLCFTKFSDGRSYPLNLHILDAALHDVWAKNVQTASPEKLQKMLNVITSAEALRFAYFNAMVSGLKNYITVRLSDADQLAKLSQPNKSAAFDRYGRYRLLTYDEMVNRQAPDSVRQAYIDLTIDGLKLQLADSSSYAMEKRPVTRKFLADAWYRKSLLDKKNGIQFLQLAADYMPSQEDKRGNYWEIDKEYPFLPKKEYNQLFIESAEKSGGSKEELLESLADIVIVEPERYASLKEKYAKSLPGTDFKAWFGKTLKKKLPASPDFVLSETSGMQMMSAQHKGKFLFIDFWGTWCGACVAEIDKIEELHQKNNIPEKLVVTTIACFDKPNIVDEFMAKRNFTYQVLMSDNKIEHKFNVSHYPTKILLLPNGTYVNIPYTEDYRAMIDKYLQWEL